MYTPRPAQPISCRQTRLTSLCFREIRLQELGMRRLQSQELGTGGTIRISRGTILSVCCYIDSRSRNHHASSAPMFALQWRVSPNFVSSIKRFALSSLEFRRWSRAGRHTDHSLRVISLPETLSGGLSCYRRMEALSDTYHFLKQ